MLLLRQMFGFDFGEMVLACWSHRGDGEFRCPPTIRLGESVSSFFGEAHTDEPLLTSEEWQRQVASSLLESTGFLKLEGRKQRSSNADDGVCHMQHFSSTRRRGWFWLASSI